LEWARSATKHRISRERSRYGIEGCDLFLEQAPPTAGAVPQEDPRLLFLGEDREGVVLEVAAVELADATVLVIHAMSMRDRYAEMYEEMKKWRR